MRSNGRWVRWLVPAVFIALSLILAVVTVRVGTEQEPNRLAASLLQGITIVVGTVGSFLLGRNSSEESARELIRPHARSAFRRVLNLYRALGRQREAIAGEGVRLAEVSVETSEGRVVSLDHAQASLVALSYIVVEQISTADDALEDWRDIVPDEVAAIEAAAQAREDHNE